MLACAGHYSTTASAQDDQATQREMQRSSMERDRQSDAFALQLQQRQRELLAPADGGMEALHADQRGRFEQLLDEQRTSARNANINAPSWGPSLNLGPQMERERRMALDRARREAEAR